MSLIVDPYAQMMPTGLSYTSDDVIGCARECLESQQTCYSFSFDENTLRCQLGTWVLTNTTAAPRRPQVKIYTQGAVCNTTENFQLVSYENVTTCIWVSSFELNYTDSMNYCTGLNGYLYTIKSLEKLYILNTFPPTFNDFWVGLNDMETEGVYIWVDDGSVLDNATMSWIFSPGQPNNLYNDTLKMDQDCVRYSTYLFPLNDFHCCASKYFLCEIRNILTWSA